MFSIFSFDPVVSASGIIFNPYYEFPPDRSVQVVRVGGAPEETTPKIKIVEPCKITLSKQKIVLLFDDTGIAFRFDSEEHGKRLFDPLLYFICFKSFLNYNLYSATVISDTYVGQMPEVQRVLFNLGRVVKKHSEDRRSYYYDGEPFQLTLQKKEIEDFLDVLNINLFLALSYYLTGCDNQRYFLVEFYKSVESIRNFFKSEDAMMKGLKPYGVNRTDFKKLNRYANNELEPLNIGRHAPKRYDKMLFVDVRRLLEEPKSKEIFEESTRICRATIEAFIRCLTSTKGKTH